MEKTRKVSGFKVSESAYWKLIRENKGMDFVKSMAELNPDVKEAFGKNTRIARDLEIAASQRNFKEKRVAREIRQLYYGEDADDLFDLDKGTFTARSGILDEILVRDLGAKVNEIKKMMNVADFSGFVWNETAGRFENENFWIELYSTKEGDYGEDKMDWGQIE